MDFFQKIHQLGLIGDLKICCQSVGDKMVVSVILVNEQCGDKARQQIKPLLFNGHPQAIDEAFITKITEPFQQTSQLLVSMEDHLKSVTKASEESALEKAKTNRLKKEADEQKKGFEASMIKVVELEAAGKYREACSKLPDPSLFPIYQQEIASKREVLVQKFSTPMLFEKTN